MKKAIIVDIDGTLADVAHRLHHLEEKPQAWDSFHKELIHDKVNPWCVELIWALHEKDFSIVLLTGRDDQYRELTLNWLSENKIPYDKLYMRKMDDYRNDDEIKKDFYLNHIKKDYDILFAVEDRGSVVKMWRDELHLPCLQCDWGNF